jgi:hypothetical protein
MPVSASVAPYNVEITSKYVIATAKCSCSLSDDYKHHTRVFYNYDPSSHMSGVLAFEQGAYYGYNSGSSPEINSLRNTDNF